MKEFNVIIPESNFQIIDFIQEDINGIACINTSLKNFEHKIVFACHLSIWIELEESNNEILPTENEIQIIELFETELNVNLIGANIHKPNSMFLAKIFWNNSCELIWRIYNPELANEYMQKIINEGLFSHDFDFRIDIDADWKLAEWHLNSLKFE